jgi:hypothetical protein
VQSDVFSSIHALSVFSTSGVFLLWREAGTLTSLLPGLNFPPCSLAFCLELVIAGTKLSNGLFGEQLLESPLINVLGLVFLQLGDE